MDETRLYKSRRKLMAHILGGALLAALCPFIAMQGEDQPMTRVLAGWVGALLFGAGALFAARDLLHRQAVLVLDGSGVSGPGLATMRFVPWRAINSVTLSGRRKRDVLLTIDEDRVSAEERAAMAIETPMRDPRGYLLAQIKVIDLSLKADALARLLADGARKSDAGA